MKKLSPGIWTETEGNIQIIINENMHTIGAIMPTGKPVIFTYPEIPTIENYIRFREAIAEAQKVFNQLNIPTYERC